MIRLLHCVALLLWALTSAACVSVHERVGVDADALPNAVERLDPGSRILLLDPQVDFTFHSFSHDPLVLPAQKEHSRDMLLGSMANTLLKLGFTVVSKQSDAQRVFMSRRLVSNYSELMNLRNYADDPLPTLGPAVNRLTAASGIDWLLISRFSGVQKSVAQHRKDRLTASMRALVSIGTQKPQLLPIQFANLEIALLDGVSGQVTWRAHTAGPPAQLASMVEKLLSTLPEPAGN